MVMYLSSLSFLTFSACELESTADSTVTITPSSSAIYINQSVALSASGGYEYTWTLAYPEWGVLSATEGATVSYTSRYDPVSSNGYSVVQTVVVQSTISGTLVPLLRTSLAP